MMQSLSELEFEQKKEIINDMHLLAFLSDQCYPVNFHLRKSYEWYWL